MNWHTERGLSTRFYGLKPERHAEVVMEDGVFRWRLFEGPRLVRRGAERSRRVAQSRAHWMAEALGWRAA